MIEKTIDIETPDGKMETFAVRPEGDGPFPAVILYMDAPGIRNELRDFARLASLAPGFGAASVAGFLRPLRERWDQAREIPLHPAARAAAVHLGLLAEGEDTEGEPGALRAALGDDPAQPSLADAEFALTRIGRVACMKNRSNRCLLADACPLLAIGS